MYRRLLAALVLVCVALVTLDHAMAAAPAVDVEAATDAYLATVSGEARERSDAYFEGGYWIKLWSFAFGAVVAIVLLQRRISARMRDFAGRVTKRAWIQPVVYWWQYLLVTSAALFPWSYYTGFHREHSYGLATQEFGAWFGDRLKALSVGLVLGGVAIAILYAVFRRAPKMWWVWGAAVSLVLLSIGMALGPVYIAPLFNEYTALAEGPVREAVLQMAHANGVDATEVFMSDASAQSTRISANVAGMLGTERITLNDNLLQRCNQAEIEAVMGHELGHYVLGHVYEGMTFFGLLALAGAATCRFGFEGATRRWGEIWGVRGIADPAGLPILALVLSIFGFVATPLTNSYIRANEAEADIFGLNVARQPDGFATVALKLGDYRKLDPSPLEETIFFDHPSGRTRIRMAMRWKAASR